MSKKLISICIPTYNRAGYIGRCIESALACIDDDIEVIVLNNFSTDHTIEVVKKYADPRLRFFSNNSNIGALRNIRKIIDYAEGEYCFFLTDDDMLVPGSMSMIKDYISKNDPHVFTSALIVYLEKTLSTSISGPIRTTKKPEELSVAEKASVFIRSHILSGVCFKRKLLNYELYDDNLSLWYPSMLMMGSLSEKMGYIASPLIIHIWENDLFWGPNSNSDQLYSSYLDGIFLLKEKLGEELFHEVCIQSIFMHSHKGFDKRFEAVISKQLIRKIKMRFFMSKVNQDIKQVVKRILGYKKG